MKASIAVTVILTSVFSANAFSAKDISKQESQDVLVIQKKIVSDGYFSTGQCRVYIEQLNLSERGVLESATRTILTEDNFVYVTGAGASLSSGYEKLLPTSGYNVNPELLDVKNKLSGNEGYITSYSNKLYSGEKIKDARTARRTILGNYPKDSVQREGIVRYIYCKIAENVVGKGEDASVFKDYVSYSDARRKTADIGYFNISADSAYYGPSVNTGNRFAEPKKWDGSRFFVIRASFKNLDTESRLPAEGSLFISYNGKEYEFDSVEPIMLEGYNIWFKKINPLITMKTKIVYRIPDEIHGEVFWRPGRNSSGTKLWLGSISAAKVN